MRFRTFGKFRKFTATLAAVLVAAGLAACSSGPSGGDPMTITYWASNQGPTVQRDKEILTPELEAFTRQTGIKVNLEVIDWQHLLDRITTATTSGDGPDVVNIGNTWSASLQATGAFVDFDDATLAKVGGGDKFLATSMSSTGAAGITPTSVPIYGLSYGLFYNKKAFEAAGITSPPASWSDFLAAAKKLTDPAAGTYGISLAGASYTEGAHFAFILGKQHGGSFFDASGRPTFATPQNVAAIEQYIALLGTEKVAVPSSAEHARTADAVADFTSGKAAMMIAQTNTTAAIAAGGMAEGDYGVAPMPINDPLPAGGERVNSHVAGINIAAFKDKNTDGALKLIEFLTSPAEQVKLNQEFGSLPVTKDAAADPAFQGAKTKIFLEELATTSAPMPMVPNESQFETTVGSAVKEMLAQIAGGKPVTQAEVQAALAGAQQKLGGTG
ncbi:ABC transporter substrate-binding protein [Pseudonocardia sp. TRM90224]|uniref:ABC transporter substrate-binding protein n=1 Tax=Pseudonocardia sp. TRM90224 TaxID=2812678 RepID=UPI001E4317B5|nr:sugar ABC transporter substrate-binding protein [Pseudonocardia sp. TRM90224]